MNPNYYVTGDLLKEVQTPDQGILSRTIYSDDQIKIVVFGFSAGHEMRAHSSPTPATMQVLQGWAKFTLGEDIIEAGPGTLAHMTPNVSHAIVAETPMVMLLVMYKGAR